MSDAVRQLGVVRNTTRKVLGDHPTAKVPGRSDVNHPAITPDAAERFKVLLKPSVISAVGKDDFEQILGRLDGGLFGGEGESASEIIESPGPFRATETTWSNKVRAVAGLRRARESVKGARLPFGVGTQTVQGKEVLNHILTLGYWGGLQDAVLFGSALSAQVTFGEKLEAAGQGAAEGAEVVGEVIGKGVEATAGAAGAIAGGALSGFINGLGPLGLVIVAGVIFFALEN
jgi:hypothetical protein